MSVLPTCVRHLGVYFDECYLRTAALADPEARLEVFRHGEAIVPLMVKPLPARAGEGCDAATPYDFCGPVLNGESSADVWAAFRAWASQLKIVTAFFRFHPFLGEPSCWGGLDGLTIAHSGDNVVIDLDEPQAMLARAKPAVRRDLKVAHRERVVCHLRPIDQEGLDVFLPLYFDTMKRRGAARFYFFSRVFFEALVENLGEAFMLATACVGGRTVAASLILIDGATAYYYLSGFDFAARRALPMNMLMFETACRLFEQGVKQFHLGGGSAGLLAFKGRFGPGRVPYYVGCTVLDAERYHQLSQGISTEFFPAYRAPGLQ